MQLSHDDLGGRDPFFLMNIHRDTAAIIPDRYGTVTVKSNEHQIAIAGQCFVNGVIDNLVNHVMQA